MKCTKATHILSRLLPYVILQTSFIYTCLQQTSYYLSAYTPPVKRIIIISKKGKKKRVKQSRYRPGVAQRVPGS